MNSENAIQNNINDYIHPLFYGNSASLEGAPEYDCFQFLLIEHGSATLCYDDSILYLTAPALICINEKDKPVFRDCKEANCKSIYFYPNLINPIFNYDSIRSTNRNFSVVEEQDVYLLVPFIHRDKSYKGYFSIDLSTYSKVAKLFEYIKKELQLKRDGYWPCRSRSYLLELLILTNKLYDSAHRYSEDDLNNIPDNIAEIITYLHNNYKDKITLSILATKFATNRTSLNEQFYKATNISIIEYLIRLRVNLASTMLRDTLIPISEIMTRVGFSDSSHFWRTFKKHTSLSPKEYREKYCWVED